MKKTIKSIGLLAALATTLANPLFSQVPDLTKDAQTVNRKETNNLGATGLRGWIYTKAANNLDAAQGRTTLASRQILVTHVGAASPADGVMKVDDVIIGVDGKPFSDDARKSFALAIQQRKRKLWTECSSSQFGAQAKRKISH
jgi:PDZ domain-containing secreted protein